MKKILMITMLLLSANCFANNKISPYVYKPYSDEMYSNRYKMLSDRRDIVEKVRIAGAEKAAKSPSCDYVEVSELSSKSTKDNVQVFIDCSNMQRFYFSEKELKANKQQLKAESEKSVAREDAILQCKAMIKDKAILKDTVDTHDIIGTSYYKAPTNGNVVINMDFDVKNGLNQTVKYKAKCIFPVDGNPEIEIIYR